MVNSHLLSQLIRRLPSCIVPPLLVGLPVTARGSTARETTVQAAEPVTARGSTESDATDSHPNGDQTDCATLSDQVAGKTVKDGQAARGSLATEPIENVRLFETYLRFAGWSRKESIIEIARLRRAYERTNHEK